MKLTIHAGHNPDGNVACGAVGFLKESTCAREIVHHLAAVFSETAHHVSDVTVNNGVSATDVLQKLTYLMNAEKVDLNISIHLNAANEASAKGVECYYYEGNGTTRNAAEEICKSLSDRMGYKNRGAKPNKTLYVIRKTMDPTILVECGFVTNKEDCERYDAKQIAESIYDGLRKAYNWKNELPEFVPADNLYRVQLGAFAKRENAEKLATELKTKGYDTFITT